MKRRICLLLFFLCLSMRLCYAQKAKEIVFYNWEEYTDKSLLEDFRKQTGIKVILKEFKTQDEMIAELQSQPENFDVILMDDQSIGLLEQYRLIAPLDLAKIPNAKFIKPQFKGKNLEQDNKYSIAGPLWGMTGIVINTNFVPADTNSWAVLWDKKNKGKIAVLDDCREVMTVLLKYSNFSLNSTNPNELAAAEKNAALLKENDVQFGDTFENIEKVLNGELWCAQAYSGDVINKAKDRTDIKCIFPQEGYNVWMDRITISIDSSRKEEAYKFINFMLEPRNAARTANMFFYPTTIEADVFLNEDNKNNFKKYFSAETLQKGEFAKDIGVSEIDYSRIFNFLKLKEKEK